jgi:hypothetical protein
MRWSGFLVAAAALLSVAAPVRAELLPEAEPYEDAGDVALVAEARVTARDRVVLTRTLHAVTPLGADVRELRVSGLSRHSRKIGEFGPDEGRELATQDCVLFLDFDDATSAWVPVSAFPDGSAGVYWVQDGKVWSYAQVLNPGPLVLTPWRPGERPQDPQGTIEQLRADVAAGVAARRAWDEDLRTTDRRQLAAKLARWMRSDTSPDGPRHRRRKFAARLRLARLGSAAVPALLDVIRAEGDDEGRENAIGAIGDIGEAAADAVPALLLVAQSPGKLSRGVIAYALRGTASASSVVTLQKYFDEASLEDAQVLEYAADALVRLKDPTAEDRFAKKLPAKLDRLESSYGVLAVLDKLHGLDDKRARAWLKPRADHPLFAFDRERVDRVLFTTSDGEPLPQKAKR